MLWRAGERLILASSISSNSTERLRTGEANANGSDNLYCRHPVPVGTNEAKIETHRAFGLNIGGALPWEFASGKLTLASAERHLGWGFCFATYHYGNRGTGSKSEEKFF